MATDDELRDELWEVSRGSQKAWAKKHKITRQYVNMVCNGKKPMTDEMADILGYDTITVRTRVKRKPKK